MKKPEKKYFCLHVAVLVMLIALLVVAIEIIKFIPNMP